MQLRWSETSSDLPVAAETPDNPLLRYQRSKFYKHSSMSFIDLSLSPSSPSSSSFVTTPHLPLPPPPLFLPSPFLPQLSPPMPHDLPPFPSPLFTPSPTPPPPSLSLAPQFVSFLFSKRNSVFNEDHATVYQEMDRPLAHYWIASSHNTSVNTPLHVYMCHLLSLLPFL